MIHVLTKCPVCTHQLKAVKLTCQNCGTNIENTFDFPKLMHLTRDQLDFVEVFILCRGNIKDVEKELNISYPTVRAKLDQVIEELSDTKVNFAAEDINEKKRKIESATSNRQMILDQLEKGEISPEEAVLKLKK
jgi:hypothetical protein